MGHEETIRIYRSDVPGAEPPSLTYGELAANLYDKKLFVGGTGGTANMLVFVEGANASIPLASYEVTGAASFSSLDFGVSSTGHVSLTGNVARTTLQNLFAPSQVFLGGLISASGITSIATIETTETIKANKLIQSFAGFSGPSAYISSIVHPSGGITLKPEGNNPLINSSIKFYSHLDQGNILYSTLDAGAISHNRLISLPDGNGILALQSELISVTAGRGSGIQIDFTETSRKFTNIGVTGISAGHTGIALDGTTGNVQIFNMGVLSIDGFTGHIDATKILDIVGPTGETVQAGTGISTAKNGNEVTVINIGVTSILHDDATITGDIKFNPGKGITFAYGTGGLTFTNTGVLTINGDPPNSEGNFTIDAATAITGDGGALVGDGVRIKARIADNSVTGVASFNSTFFTVTDGEVSLSDVYGTVGVTGISAGHTGIALDGTTGNVQIFNMGVLSINGQTGHYTLPEVGPTGDTVLAGSGIVIPEISGNTKTIINIGVTGISAGHTGIALDGTTGNVQIFNMGVLSIDGKTGHVSAEDIISIVGPTGDTVQAGDFINIDANKTINNVGVQTFNGLTGAVSMTGDGGAVIGIGNNAIGVKLASDSVTGVASFNSTFFAVTDGEVSLSSVYGTVGVTGLSAGHTGIALSGTTGNIQIFNMGILSIDGQTGHYTLPPVGATGDTVLAGSGIVIPEISGNTKTIINIGVTSFNGLTGAVTYAPPIASIGVSGVASFSSNNFAVSGTGHVSLKNDSFTVNSGAGIAVNPAGKIVLGEEISIANTGVTSFNGQTGSISLLDFIEEGNGIALTPKSGNTVIVIENTGVVSLNGLTGARTLTGDGGAIFGASNNIIGARLADNSVTGVASFNSTFFTVTDGEVSLSDVYGTIGVTGLSAGHTGIALDGTTGNIKIFNMGVLSFNGRTGHIEEEDLVGDIVQAGGAIDITKVGNVATISNIGVTGLSAGHTGIALDGTTGNVQIFNMGVLSINGQTGHYTLPEVGPTGDTVNAGNGIFVSNPSPNVATVTNMGVTSILLDATTITGDIRFNPGKGITFAYGTGGLTFTNTGVLKINGNSPNSEGNIDVEAATAITGDGGALVGDGVRIKARIADNSVTGVASFNSTFFTVTDGEVSLSDVYGTVGVTGISAGHTGIALDGTTGNVQIFNMGVLSFIGQTGHVTPPIATINGQGNTGTRGVATFNETFFAVSSNGAVGLKDAFAITKASFDEVVQFNTVGDNAGTLTITGSSGIRTTVSGGGSPLFTILNTGVTGISAGHTGIALIGTTGNVRVFNMGVLSIDGKTGHVSAEDIISIVGPTGDTVQAGDFINIDANKTINNVGVQTFNGLTGAVSMTGDGGAIVGVSNNKITAKLSKATTDLPASGTTGVAAFFNDHFIVTTQGLVKLKATCPTCSNPENYFNQTDCVNAGCEWCNGFCQDPGTCLGGGDICDPFGGFFELYSGIGASSASDGSLSYFYLDIGSLSAAPENSVSNTDQILFFDADETALIKTKKISAKSFVLSDSISDLFTTNTPDQLQKAKNSSSISYSIKTGFIADGEGGLIKGGTAYEYISQNTVASVNGKTGSVNCIAVTCDAQSFTGLQTFVTGISAANLWVSGGATLGSISAPNLVSSFNNLTGAVSYSPPLATNGVSGIASFLSSDFAVSVTGHVSLASKQITINSGAGISTSPIDGKIVLGETITIANLGVTSFNGQTGNISLIDFIGSGEGIALIPKNGNTFVDITNKGVLSLNGLTGARTLTGDGGALAGVGNDKIVARIADNSVTGVASFLPKFFNVSNGAVGLSGVYATVGVTGISAGHTGIALDGTTGNVRVFNMGVHTFNGQTGHITFSVGPTGNTVLPGSGIAISSSDENTKTIVNIGVTSFNGATGSVFYAPPLATLTATGVASFNSTYFTVTNGAVSLASAYQATGDTVQAGDFINIDANKTINNVGVQTFNGLTGAVSMTGDGGALAGGANNAIRARLATASLTGVASFPTADFGVVDGIVSLTGNVARTNVSNNFTASNTFSAFQFFPQGFNAAKGVTFGSTTEPVNVSQNLNVVGIVSASNILTWESVSSNKGLLPYKGVFANKSPASGKLILTIENNSSSSGIGTPIEISGLTGSWRIKIPNNHTVHFGSVTVAGSLLADGYLESTHHRDSLRLVCCAKTISTSEWNVLSSVGSINYGVDTPEEG